MTQPIATCSLEALRSIIDVVSTPMIVVDRSHRMCLVNRAGSSFIGRPAEQIVGTTYFDFLPHDEAEAGTATDERIFQSRKDEEGEARVTDSSGTVRTLVTRKHLVDAGDGSPLLVVLVYDVTAYREAEARNLHLALHDVMTGLPNRALLRDRMEQALARMLRHSRQSALLYIDLDRFKEVNDTYGHQAGDDLMRGFVSRVVAGLRPADTMARLGGDEFAIFLSDLFTSEDAFACAQRVLEQTELPFEVTGGEARVGASIGIVLVSDPVLACDEIHRRADVALYQAKSSGRGCFKVYHAAMEDAVERRRRIEADLRAALRTGNGFEVRYQAIFSGDGAHILGMQADLYWNHSELGIISPSEAAAVAEEAGLAAALGEWILASACATLGPWAPVTIAVHLLPAQLRDRGFAGRLQSLLAAHDIPANRIQLELNEAAILQAQSTALDSLRKLADHGIDIVIDDFGSSYSALSQLRQRRLSKVKIDLSKLDLSRPASAEKLLGYLVAMGQGLGFDVTADGIDCEQQRQLLVSLGCTELQGGLFSAQRSAAEASALLGSILKPV